VSARSCGSVTLPSDFDSFCPRLSRSRGRRPASAAADPRAHQEGRPVDRVEADDVLADQVQVGRPELRHLGGFVGIAEAGEVVGQRVDPHVHHVVLAAGHLDAPVEAGAADREVAQPALDEAPDLVQAARRAHEVGIVAVEREQRLLVLRQAEEPGFLDRPFDRRALRRELFAPLALRQLALVVIGLVAHRVPALVAVEVEVAVRLHRPPDRLARAVVLVLGGAEEAVVGNSRRSNRARKWFDISSPVARGDAQLARLLRHLEPVLVGPGLEAHLAAHQPLEAGDDVGRDRLVGMADVRLAVGIMDRGGDVVGLSHANPPISIIRSPASKL
jgi:hypothetical protein